MKLTRWYSSDSNSIKRRPAQSLSRRLLLEKLEDRCNPATFTLTSTNTAEFLAAIADASTNSEADIIDFEFGVTGTIVLNSALTIDTDITIRGGSQVTLSGDTNSSGSADDGDTQLFIVADGGTLTLEYLAMTNGYSATNGGAITVESGGLLQLLGSSITESYAGMNGGAIYVDGGSLWAQSTVFDSNQALQSGGAVASTNSGRVEFHESEFIYNFAVNGDGGALHGDGAGAAYIDTTRFSSNYAQNGGGVYYAGNIFDLSYSLFDNNTAAVQGGALYLGSINDVANIYNTTLSGNNASTGAALLTETDLILTNATIVFNNSDTGLTISGTADVILNNTLMANPLATGEISGIVNLAASHNNLIQDATTAGGLSDGQLGNIVGVTDLGNVIDASLADNGGATLTHALLPGSIAINAGDIDSLLEWMDYDQRGYGFNRLSSGHQVDIGAFEFQALVNPEVLITLLSGEPIVDTFQVLISSDDPTATLPGDPLPFIHVPNGFQILDVAINGQIITLTLAPPHPMTGTTTIEIDNGLYVSSEGLDSDGTSLSFRVDIPDTPAPPVNVPPTNATFVTKMYRELLRREPDPQGLATWLTALQRGQSRSQIIEQVTRSREYYRVIVTDMYEGVLEREPDAQGLEHWVDKLAAGTPVEDLYIAFLSSDEYFRRIANGNNAVFVESVYQWMLQRDADSVGRQHWLDRLNGGESRSQVVGAIMNGPEFTRLFVLNAYEGILDRQADKAGEQSWFNQLRNDDDFGFLQLAESFFASEEFFQKSGLNFSS